MSDFFASQAFRQAQAELGFSETRTRIGFGVWEPEDSECFARSSDLTDFYSVLSRSSEINMINPAIAHYSPVYVTLGLSSPEDESSALGITIRSRFHFNPNNNAIRDSKFCIKDAGKETTRREFQSGRKTMCVEGNMRKLIAEHPDLPVSVARINTKKLFVDSAQSISRSGFFFAHQISPGIIVWHAGSLDVCAHSTPAIYKDIKRESIVRCGQRNEGEYEAIGVDIKDPTMMSDNGIRYATETSLKRLKEIIANSGLPTIPNTMNKVESAQLSAAAYFEENHSSCHGRLTALAQNMRPKDYQRGFMKAALGQLSADLPTPGTLYPRQMTFADNGLLVPAIAA